MDAARYTIHHMKVHIISSHLHRQLMSLKGGGPLVPEHGFWMDGFKKHCYATFQSEECAARAREGLYGLKWPDERGGSLTAEFAPTGVTAQQVGFDFDGGSVYVNMMVAPVTSRSGVRVRSGSTNFSIHPSFSQSMNTIPPMNR